jgi:hypothetical protein
MGRQRLRTTLVISTTTVAALFFSVLTAQAQIRNNAATLGQFSESLQELSSRVSPSVVQIVGTGFGFENDGEHAGVSVLSKQKSTASGVIVSEDGYIAGLCLMQSSSEWIAPSISRC